MTGFIKFSPYDTTKIASIYLCQTKDNVVRAQMDQGMQEVVLKKVTMNW